MRSTEWGTCMAGERKLVALVGRPNVGKSTLFNRLVRKRRAIVEDAPGVTRDRHYADAEFDGVPVTLIDTGGFVPSSNEGSMEALVRLQAQAAVEECAVVVLVTDGRSGRAPGDEEVARFLRRSGRPVVLAVNKADDARLGPALAGEFHRLGLGDPVPVSAEHNHGIGELQARVCAHLPKPAEDEEDAEGDDGFVVEAEGEGEGDEDEAPTPKADRPTRVAIVGRPNVGKSTLVNALLGEERMIASPVAGTTRDSIDSELEHKGGQFILTDTAGIRRKATIAQKVEQFSVLQALKVLEGCDVAVVVLDATEPAVDQDAKIAGIAQDKGRPLLFVVNKWDLVQGDKRQNQVREDLKQSLRWAAYAPVLFVSAKQGLKVEKVLELAKDLHRQATFKAPTSQLNRVLEHVTTEHPLPFENGKALKLYYVAQTRTSPPTFQFVSNRPGGVPERYQRYLVNQLRETFGLRVPIWLKFVERPGRAKREAAVAKYRGHRQKARR